MTCTHFWVGIYTYTNIHSTTNCRQSSSRSLARINQNKTKQNKNNRAKKARAHTHQSKQQTKFWMWIFLNFKHFYFYNPSHVLLWSDLMWCDPIRPKTYWIRWLQVLSFFFRTQTHISMLVLYLQFERIVNRFFVVVAAVVIAW